MQWSKEVQVDEWVREKLKSMGLKLGKDFLEKDASAYLKDALKGASKTKKQSGTGIPDFVIEKYKVDNEIIPVIFECKLGVGRLEKYAKDNEKALVFSNDAISKYALNGALHYARVALQNESQKQDHYKEIIAIGIAGDNSQNVKVKIACVFADSSLAYKEIKRTNLDFLENTKSFTHFYKEECKLTEEDKHLILIRGKWHLSHHSAQLNKLMHNHNITAPQRVLYIAGMILSMQSVMSNEYRILTKGLNPADLQGSQEEGLRDGELVFERIEEFLKVKVPDSAKRKLMLDSFNEIRKDGDRDKIPKNFTYKEGEKKNPNHKIIAHILKEPSSINKQIFAYIYTYIYKEIDGLNGHLDIMGECYSEFLKYALGDGKELGIVLTPPYVTKMMTQILDITSTDRVMDLATGSAGFLISSMEQMIEDVYKNTAKHSTQANKAILELKTKQLLGIEYNAEMFALATANMILRGDGSSKIYKANTFETENSLYEQFEPTRVLLNPPFTWDYNGLPFIEFGLDRVRPHGLGAIIIQDSAGNGQATPITQSILTKHTLKASIKMPIDLFQPMAGVQTSIYIFEAKIPHDFEKPVKFIDFRNDGYKRTKRSLQEVDKPAQRYRDILKIYKQGLNAKIDNSVYEKPINLSEVYVEDFITDSGADWNFDQHKKIDTTPTLADFKKCVSEYLVWEVSNVLKNSCHTERSEVSKNTDSTQGGTEGNALSPRLVKLEAEFKQNGGEWKSFRIGELFDHLKPIKHTYNKGNLPTEPTEECDLPAITCTSANQGIACYMPRNGAEILKNVISVAANGDAPAFYQPHDFAILQDAYALRFKSELIQESLELSPLCYLYLTALLQKVLQKYNWNDKSGWAKVSQEIISLPILLIPSLRGVGEAHNEVIHKTQQESKMDCHEVANAISRNDKSDYKIAFNYMESYIKELEAERLQELEAYLKVTGLNDYTLSQKEKEALRSFENLSIPQEAPLKWKSFKCEELFSVKSNPQLNKDSFSFSENAPYPYFTRTCLNNGIAGYVEYLDEEHKIKGESIAVGMLGMQFFYMQKDFYAGQFTKTLYPKFSGLNATIAQFFIAWLNKHQKIFQGVLVRDFEKTFNETEILLPVLDSHNIDFDFIESFIKAIQKECIKSVVLWQEGERQAYKKVVKQ